MKRLAILFVFHFCCMKNFACCTIVEIPRVISENDYSGSFKEGSSSAQNHLNRALVQTERLTNFTKNNQHYVTDCANVTSFRFQSESFLNYLLRVRTCDAYLGTRELQTVCDERLYAITTFYKLSYMHFCEPKLYDIICKENAKDEFEGSAIEMHSEISSVQEKTHWAIPNNPEEYNVLRQGAADFISEENEELLDKACDNVEDFFNALSSFEINTGLSENHHIQMNFHSDGHDYHKIPIMDMTRNTGFLNGSYIVPAAEFYEWFVPVVPFCKPYTCAASKKTYDEKTVSSYSCMPTSCRAVVVVVILIDCLLSIVTVVANSLVLAVAIRTKIMRNIPGYFKISLAVADLLVGAIVLPGSIYNAYTLYLHALPLREPGQKPAPTDYFSRHYLNFMGFFTVLPICISLYTMGVASLDRFLAITKPFKYRQGCYLTKKRCIAVFVIIWLFGFIMAIFPIITTDKYISTAFTLFLSTGVSSAFVYAVGLGIPLLAVWFFNTAMLRNVCADGEKRRSIRVARPSTPSNNVISNIYSREETGSTAASDHSNTSIDRQLDEPSTAELKVENNNYELPDEKNMPEEVTPPKHFLNTGSTESVNRKNSITSNNTINYYRKDIGTVIQNGAIKQRINRKERRQSIFRASLFTTNHNQRIASPAAAVEHRLARTLAIMIGAFSIALIPCIIILLVGALVAKKITPSMWPELYSTKSAVAIASAIYVASRLLLSNSFWNCIIYSIRNRHFRRALFAVFLCNKRKIDRHLRQSISFSSQWKRRSVGASFSNANEKHPVLSKANSATSGNSVASAPANGYGNSRRSTGLWSLSTTHSASRYNSNMTLNNRNMRAPVTKTISLPDMATRSEQHKQNDANRDFRRYSEHNHRSNGKTFENQRSVNGANLNGHRMVTGVPSIERIDEE